MFRTQSVAMRLLRSLGMESLAWSLRRLHCPVDKRSLVLEVGSGGNPYFRSNVLLDAYQETRERHWATLVADRPTVLGFVENLPFKDKIFDYVIAAHVFEHSADPEKFISEIQRVGKAGYIEVPHAFMERVNPYMDHRLEIYTKDDELVIRKKSAWRQDSELVELYEQQAKNVISRISIPKNPFSFHVRYYWTDKIKYTILNPEVDARWAAPAVLNESSRLNQRNCGFRDTVLHAVRLLMSQNRRNRLIHLIELLRCPKCKTSEPLIQTSESEIICGACQGVFSVTSGVPNLVTSDD
jgi:uncharacterized protein YbaR (Trm112 family)